MLDETTPKGVFKMLTVKDTAKRFGISERAVRRWVAEGTIPVTRSGNRAYINPNWLEDKLNKHGALDAMESKKGRD